MQHANAVTVPVYWYFYCNFQQNIASFVLCMQIQTLCYRLGPIAVMLLFVGALWRSRNFFREEALEVVVK